jgi:BASS family bile acid:Na+ symporter
MTVDRMTSLVVSVTLIELMISVGLGITVTDLREVTSNRLLLLKAAFANYILVPAITILLLLVFQPGPMATAGFLILAVCPGAPFGPQLSALAKGNMAVAVGLMVVLAGSSAIVAPVLLGLLMPLMAGAAAGTGNQQLQVHAGKIVLSLLVTQLAPLCVGIGIRHFRPNLAKQLLKPAMLINKILSLLMCALILGTQYHLLAEIRLRGYFGMLLLFLSSLCAGWLLSGPEIDRRRTVTLTTALRNVGVGLVIATGSFPGTPAVTAILAYGIFEILASLLVATWWRRQSNAQTIESRQQTG